MAIEIYLSFDHASPQNYLTISYINDINPRYLFLGSKLKKPCCSQMAIKYNADTVYKSLSKYEGYEELMVKMKMLK
jgi:hypothetical protein